MTKQKVVLKGQTFEVNCVLKLLFKRGFIFFLHDEAIAISVGWLHSEEEQGKWSKFRACLLGFFSC